MEKSKGVNVCTLWTPNQNEDFKVNRLHYYWGESSTAASLVDLIKRTLAGELQAIEIWSKDRSDQRDVSNLFVVLGNQAQPGCVFICHVGICPNQKKNMQYMC